MRTAEATNEKISDLYDYPVTLVFYWASYCIERDERESENINKITQRYSK